MALLRSPLRVLCVFTVLVGVGGGGVPSTLKATLPWPAISAAHARFLSSGSLPTSSTSAAPGRDPNAYRFTVDGAVIHVDRRRVEARSARTNRRLWTFALPPGPQVRAARHHRTVLVIKADPGSWRLYAAVLDARTGRVLRQADEQGRVGRVSSAGAGFFFEVTTTGAYTHTSTAILRAATGEPAGSIPGQRLIANATHGLFAHMGVVNPLEPVQLRYHRLEASTLKVRTIEWAIPERPQCGAVEKTDSGPGNEHLTGRYVYAVRHDRCGTFVARFDWMRPRQVPWTYPKP